MMINSAWAQPAEAVAKPPNFMDALQQMAPALLMVMAVFYFIMIRPAQKKQRQRQELLGNLKKGNKVVTTSGIIGTIVGTSEKTVVLKIADNVKVKMLKSAVAGLAESDNLKD